MEVRNLNEGAEKFRTRAQAAAPDYTKGVQTAGPKWLAGAEASGDVYAAGVQEAIAQGRFAGGVRRAGAGRYQDRAVKLGGDRYRTGVVEGAADWSKGYAPMADALRAVNLGPKSIRGSAQNYDRARKVGEALRAAKLAQVTSR